MADEPLPTVRTYAGPGDHPGMVRVRNAVFGGDDQPAVTVADFDARYANLQADLLRDCFVVEVAGQLHGYARLNADEVDPSRVQASMVLLVDPNAPARRVAIDALIAAALVRARALPDRTSPARATRIVASFRGPDADVIASLEDNGFRELSREHALIHRHLAGVEVEAMPPGFELIAVTRHATERARAIFAAAQAALADREGAAVLSDMTYEGFLELVDNDPGLWRAAVAGKEIAAVILAGLDEVGPEGARTGWMEPIAVVRRFRGRGLVGPMLTGTLRALRDAGATAASLDTHPDELDQPQALFDRLGFELVATTLEYVLDPA